MLLNFELIKSGYSLIIIRLEKKLAYDYAVDKAETNGKQGLCKIFKN